MSGIFAGLIYPRIFPPWHTQAQYPYLPSRDHINQSPLIINSPPTLLIPRCHLRGILPHYHTIIRHSFTILLYDHDISHHSWHHDFEPFSLDFLIVTPTIVSYSWAYQSFPYLIVSFWLLIFTWSIVIPIWTTMFPHTRFIVPYCSSTFLLFYCCHITVTVTPLMYIIE